MANKDVLKSVYRLLSRNAARSEVLPMFTNLYKLSHSEFPRHASDVKNVIRSEFEKPFSEDALDVFSTLRSVNDRSYCLGYNTEIDYECKYPAFLYSPPLFPGNRLKLHLFEPRYRKMIRHAQDTNQRFIYMLSQGNSDLIGSVGVMAWTQRCDFYEDGKANIELVMGPRIKVTNYTLEMVDGDALRWLNCEHFVDEALSEEDAVKVEALRLEVLDLLLNVWTKLGAEKPQKLIEDLIYHYGNLPLRAEPLSLWISSWIIPPSRNDERQAALSTDSTAARLETIKKSLEDILEQHFYGSMKKKLSKTSTKTDEAATARESSIP